MSLIDTGGVEGRFIAVGGYWYAYFLPCAYQPHIAPLAQRCGFGVLSDEPLQNPFAGPIGPDVPGRLSPALITESAASFGIAGDGNSQVVVIVHAADSRLWQCAHKDLTFCGRRPVLDRMAWVDGVDIDPTQFQPDLATTTSHDAALTAASAAAGGGQVVLAYPLDATSVQDVDPRFTGQGSDLVWYARVIIGAPDANGSSEGTDVLLDDATGAPIQTLPQAINLDDVPARVVLSSNWEGSGEARPHYAISSGDAIVAQSWLDSSSIPLALAPGEYSVHEFLATDAGVVTSETCDLALLLAAGDDLASYADFGGSTCTWKAGSLPFE